MIQFATVAKPRSAVRVLSILKSNEFRRDYHRALDSADKTPAAQEITARNIIERYFGLESISPNTPLNSGFVYFTDRPIAVDGKFKFLVPGVVKRELVAGSLFLLKPKATEQLIDTKEFDDATSAVVAVRLTLMPERVNGIISFISDAKKFYANHDAASAERAIGTALDHFGRAAAEGLRRIKTDAEKGKRANEVAGTRRKLAELRRSLQAESANRPESSNCAVDSAAL